MAIPNPQAAQLSRQVAVSMFRTGTGEAGIYWWSPWRVLALSKLFFLPVLLSRQSISLRFYCTGLATYFLRCLDCGPTGQSYLLTCSAGPSSFSLQSCTSQKLQQYFSASLLCRKHSPYQTLNTTWQPGHLRNSGKAGDETGPTTALRKPATEL